ncbi:dethiobiotin synthase [Candidatus Paracaedibacter symbiosus]|uniref:dethiobiotin synthase n=1 Tax=Candidatus Paracaedibacter symbiosus TaxID=244582 RepID=UPI00050978F6|nr:dethiobiotin synthase [Candidatus Paracaedibacter symbiosus]
MTQQFFVTGTGTDVGKTIASAWLCLKLKAAYWKPIQSGAQTHSDAETVTALTKNRGVEIFPPCYTFQAPLSPHLAASLEGQEINLSKIVLPTAERLVVEGAGGVLVPLTHRRLMVDLIQHLKLPAIVVAHTTLGTINHTLLTLEALRARQIPVKGVILNGPENNDNLWSIETYGQVSVIGYLPPLVQVTQAVLEAIPLREKI